MAIVDTVEQHLHPQRRQPQKGWISVDTFKLREKRQLAFVSWQNQCTSVERQEYVALCKEVRKAARNDRREVVGCRKGNVGGGPETEQTGRLFKKLKRLSGSKTRPVDSILDEAGQPLQWKEDKLTHWKRHVKQVLNVETAVTADVLAEVAGNEHVDTPDVTREEVAKAVRRLQNGKPNCGRAFKE